MDIRKERRKLVNLFKRQRLLVKPEVINRKAGITAPATSGLK